MIVLLMGSPYRFTKRSWKAFLRKWQVQGDIPDIDLFALRLSTRAPNITDWDMSDVNEALCDISCIQ